MSQQINLFNPALVPHNTLASARNTALGAALALAAVVVFGAGSQWNLKRQQAAHATSQQALAAAQERVTALAQQIAKQKPSPAIQAEREQAEALLKSRQNALALIGAGNVAVGGAADSSGFGEHLRGLARQSRDGLWLTQVVIGSQPADMHIKGRTVDRTLVADYVERLSAEKTFAGHAFSGLSMSEGRDAAAASAVVSGPTASSPVRSAPYIEFELTSTQAPTHNLAPSADSGTRSPPEQKS